MAGCDFLETECGLRAYWFKKSRKPPAKGGDPSDKLSHSQIQGGAKHVGGRKGDKDRD